MINKGLEDINLLATLNLIFFPIQTLIDTFLNPEKHNIDTHLLPTRDPFMITSMA